MNNPERFDKLYEPISHIGGDVDRFLFRCIRIDPYFGINSIANEGFQFEFRPLDLIRIKPQTIIRIIFNRIFDIICCKS